MLWYNNEKFIVVFQTRRIETEGKMKPPSFHASFRLSVSFEQPVIYCKACSHQINHKHASAASDLKHNLTFCVY